MDMVVPTHSAAAPAQSLSRRPNPTALAAVRVPPSTRRWHAAARANGGGWA